MFHGQALTHTLAQPPCNMQNTYSVQLFHMLNKGWSCHFHCQFVLWIGSSHFESGILLSCLLKAQESVPLCVALQTLFLKCFVMSFGKYLICARAQTCTDGHKSIFWSHFCVKVLLWNVTNSVGDLQRCFIPSVWQTCGCIETGWLSK